MEAFDGNEENDELVVSGELEGQLAPITEEEYTQALAEFETMTFGDVEVEETVPWKNSRIWTIGTGISDTMFEDIVSDLQRPMGIPEMAVDRIYNSGLEIHCAMDPQISLTWKIFYQW